MRTRWRAWVTRTAVVAIVAAVATAGFTAPAQAAAVSSTPKITGFDMHPSSMNAGTESDARFTIIANPGVGAGDWFADYQVEVSPNDGKVVCKSGCHGGQVRLDQEQTAVITTADGAFFGNSVTYQIRVTTSNCTCDDSRSRGDSLTAPLTINKTQTIPEVSGTVKDLYSGELIKTAKIEMRDSVGTTWTDIATDDNGKFIITKDLYGKDIAAGWVDVTASKDGYAQATKHVDENASKTNIVVSLISTASATPTTAEPSVTGSVDATSTEASAPAPPADSPGLSSFSIILIVVGGLLVLLGIGAIVLLFLRRGDDAGPKPGKGGPGRPGGPPGRGGPPPGQRRPGGPPTGPIRPGYGPPRPGPGGPNRDQTTIARSPLADNPTQHGRPRPGPGQPPYSGPPAPPPAGPGYGGPPQGYPQQGGGYSAQGGYGQPGYGGGQPGYAGGQQTYGGPPPGPDPRQGGGRAPGEGRRVDWMDDY